MGFLFPKSIRNEIRDSRNIQGFALIYEQSCLVAKNYLHATVQVLFCWIFWRVFSARNKDYVRVRFVRESADVLPRSSHAPPDRPLHPLDLVTTDADLVIWKLDLFKTAASKNLFHSEQQWHSSEQNCFYTRLVFKVSSSAMGIKFRYG